MDVVKLELLLSVTIMVLKLLVLAQKAGLLVRGRASSALREEANEIVRQAEELIAQVEEKMDEG